MSAPGALAGITFASARKAASLLRPTSMQSKLYRMTLTEMIMNYSNLEGRTISQAGHVVPVQHIRLGCTMVLSR